MGPNFGALRKLHNVSPAGVLQMKDGIHYTLGRHGGGLAPECGRSGKATDHRISGRRRLAFAHDGCFCGGLRGLGWIEGRTIKIEYRWSEGRPGRYAEIAAEVGV